MLTKLLIFGSRTIRAEAVGTAIDEEDAIGFSALRAVRPMIERISLAKAPEAHAKMIRNEARFRMIIDFSLRTRRGRATDGNEGPNNLRTD